MARDIKAKKLREHCEGFDSYTHFKDDESCNDDFCEGYQQALSDILNVYFPEIVGKKKTKPKKAEEVYIRPGMVPVRYRTREPVRNDNPTGIWGQITNRSQLYQALHRPSRDTNHSFTFEELDSSPVPRYVSPYTEPLPSRMSRPGSVMEITDEITYIREPNQARRENMARDRARGSYTGEVSYAEMISVVREEHPRIPSGTLLDLPRDALEYEYRSILSRTGRIR